MTDILGIFNHIQQQGEKGRQSGLARLLGKAYNAPPDQRQAMLGQVAQHDGGLAMQAGRQFREEDGEVLSQLSDHARQVVALYKADPNMAQQAYQAMLPLAQRAGITTAPQQLDDTIIGGLTQLAQVNSKAGAPAGYQEFDMLARDANLSPEDRALAARRALYLDRRPSNAAIKYDTFEGEDGKKRLFGLDPNRYAGQQIGGSASYGAPHQPGQMGGDASEVGQQRAPQGIPPGVTPQQIQAAYHAIGERNGFEVTSMQRPVMPGIGAGANSQHPNGTAVDYRTRGKTPEQIEALKRDLQSAGFEVVDESDGRTGTGPHIHAELPGAGGGADPFTSRRPEDETAATEAAKRSVGLQFSGPEAQAEAEKTRLVEEAKRGAAAGSKRDEKRIEMQGKLQGIFDRQAMVSEAIDDALSAPGFDANFGLDSLRRFIPGTEAANAKARIQTVINQIRLNVLSDMKALSPTGGAVGQVSNEEGRIMAGYLGALENSSTDEEARRVLTKIKARMEGMAQRMQDALEEDQSGQSDAAPSNDIDGLLGKYGIR